MDELGRVRAAGGVVWRLGAHATVEVLLVHRPRHDDWSLPKGKLLPGEHPLVAAIREVVEETAVRARAGARLPTVRYQVPAGARSVDKVVDYWSMAVVADPGFAPSLVPGLEVDALAWVPLTSAPARLSYPRDLTVLTAFTKLGPLPPPVVLLAPPAAAASGALARVLTCFKPDRLVASPRPHCARALGPVADLLDRSIEIQEIFDSVGSSSDAATRIGTRIAELASPAGASVVCVPETIAAAVLSALTELSTARTDAAYSDAAYTDATRTDAARTDAAAAFGVTDRGTGWVISWRDNAVVAVDALP